MTKRVAAGERGDRCAWCGRPIDQPAGVGRPRRYCRRSCRQRDYEARQRAARHGLDEADIIVARAEVDRLRDHLYALRCAVEDVDRDLAGGEPTIVDLRDALAWLLENARPVVAESP